MAVAQVSEADFVRLYQGNVVPLRVACVLDLISFTLDTQCPQWQDSLG
jgi:hypothetical protein